MIRIKCFAIVKELVGKDEIEVDLKVLKTPTIDALWNHLEESYPQLVGKKKYLRFAKNMSFVSVESELQDGDEVGIIPPVAGG